jgi:asparagine synthase (glutamine-hydrolysing)
MSGVLGWVGFGDTADVASLDAMTAPAARFDGSSFERHTGLRFALAVGGLSHSAGLIRTRGLVVALHGHPFWGSPDRRQLEVADVAALFIESFAKRDVDALSDLHGDYALALIDAERARVVLAVDRMSVRNFVYAQTEQGIVFGPTCDVVLQHPAVRREVDPQAIYNYLYFHMVPGPSTAFRGLRRLPPGHFVDFERARCSVRAHWRPRFVEDGDESFTSLKRDFRRALDESVRTFSDEEKCGTFLSGGTDSSTLAGLLGSISGAPAPTFSIGFDAEGYDEIRYARIAARHFATAHHEYYVTPADVVDAVPRIAETYDQPFGNASAVPTYYCARLAQMNGIKRMLGGDGGDELYGGNTRYARQQQFALYERVPQFLRQGVAEPVARYLPLTGRFPLLRKVRSYVTHAAMPMPERYESYNLLERLDPAAVLTSDFLASIDTRTPMGTLRSVYADTNAKSLINRMLALDFRITLADNDLLKVTRMCELARVDVAFPMLHDEVIDFSLRLSPNQKLRGTRLRYFFKEALKDFLPPEIIAKQKHGFGLPVGAWLQKPDGLRTLAGDTLATLRHRHIVRGDFLDRLLKEHLADHARYYGTMVWILMMLELWFQRWGEARIGT